jgi:hypothetical protein
MGRAKRGGMARRQQKNQDGGSGIWRRGGWRLIAPVCVPAPGIEMKSNRSVILRLFLAFETGFYLLSDHRRCAQKLLTAALL